MNVKPFLHRLRAMTLTEMLVVLAIMGILILMAYPAFFKQIVSARYKEAEMNLRELAQFQQLYFYEHAAYGKRMEDIHFEQQALATQGGNAHFKIEITEAGQQNFRARAVAVTDFDGDGTFSIWEIDKRGIPEMVQED
jgi:type IV pilus assembly protein PilE